MANYSTDQFYRFGDYEGTGKSLRRTSLDNPNFIWPGYGTPDVYNPIVGRQRVDTRMQRGFIRGIYPAELAKQSASTVPQRRLFFQFNPATIDRTVYMNQMVANPLLQDPAQLFQPVPGTAGFSFELLFNREAEVVSSQIATEQQGRNGRSFVTSTATPLGNRLSNLDSYGSSTRWDDVASLGVLADMYVLDSIIGQSITPDMVAFLKQYWQTASDVSKTYQTTGTGASFGFDSSGFETNIQKNFGNSAFLSPLPIRIVFSSLFMVEGFVESSSVQFVKFTHNYVPTICRVTLGVRALYIGFAKQEAYLTSSLKTAIADALEEQKAREATVALAHKIATTKINLRFNSPKLKKQNYNNNSDDYRSLEYGITSINFNNWWNSEEQPNPEKPDKLDLKGDIESWVSPDLPRILKENGMSWKFEATLEVVQKTGIISNVLASVPITYKTSSESEEITSETIATNANSDTTKVDNLGRRVSAGVKKQKDKWFASGETLVPKITALEASIEFTIKTKVMVTTNTGEVVSADQVSSISAAPGDNEIWTRFSNGEFQFGFYDASTKSNGGRIVVK